MVGNPLGSLGGQQLVVGMELAGGLLVMVGKLLVVVGLVGCLVVVDGLVMVVVVVDGQCPVCTIESNSGLSTEGYAMSEG